MTQLSPSAVLGGLRGMLSPSGNAKMSWRSRAYFFLEPAAIVDKGNKMSRSGATGASVAIKRKAQNNCKLSHASPLPSRFAYCAFIQQSLFKWRRGTLTPGRNTCRQSRRPCSCFRELQHSRSTTPTSENLSNPPGPMSP